MKSWGNRENFHQSVVEALLEANTGAVPAPVLTDELSTWLAQLTLLYGLPVEYLTSDARLLPTESMRFFYLDRNWLDRLVDGAMSVGVLSSLESVFNKVFFEGIYQQIDVKQQQLRADLKGETLEVTETGGVMTGILFRSQVVSGWPGIEVNAYSGTMLLEILRMDLLSDTTMLILFNGKPDKVDFIEPGEGLQFGIQREADADDFHVYLRGLGYPTGDPYEAGAQIDNLTAPGTMADTGEPGVLDITGLVASITENMPADSIPDGTLTSSAFAVQMVETAGMQTYEPGHEDCKVSNNV